MRSYKEHSKMNWGVESIQYPGDDKIQVGCLQRIADSLEKMERPFAALIEERDRYERLYRSAKDANETLLKRVAAYQGVIKKMKKQKA